jgi:energy-coupling factor transport system ATP-binding protein
MKNIIEVKNLTYSYDDKDEVIKNLSFNVEEGQYVALIGHNGSGKSTLAKLLCGLLTNFKGEITIFGKKVESANMAAIRSHLGIVFQNPDNQFVSSSVKEDIAFGLENRQIPHEQMDALINEYAEKVDMVKYLDSAPENLSGGQKQRVAIAGVLAMKPDLIIYDEATSMLDPSGKKEILALTKKMKEENPSLTIISITHDIEEAANADQVFVLNEGELVLEGTPNEVFAHEEELAKIHLAIPFFNQLRDELVKQGIEIPSNVTNLTSLEEFLCR